MPIEFQAHNEWLNISTVTISAWPNETISRPRVAISGIELPAGFWNTTDVHLDLSNCFLMRLSAYQSEKKRTEETPLNVILYNSSVHIFWASNVNLEVSESFYEGIKTVPIFFVTSSKVLIHNTSFTDMQKRYGAFPVVLMASNHSNVTSLQCLSKTQHLTTIGEGKSQ